VRMNTVSLATVTLSQAVSFWHAGTELLRSKSLDRNSYNSGDWFNRIDWTGQESTFGSGLPMKADNEKKWPIMAPLLANPALKPAAADIAAAEASALDLLRVRSEIELLRLGSADLIEQKVSFPNGGADAAPGVIVMVIDDLLGEDVDPALEGALVVFNASPDAVTQTVGGLAGRDFALTPAQAGGADPVVKTTTWDAATGTVTVPARTVAVLVDREPVGSIFRG
jgi:pullulanase/glycogen debranching enzyme